MTTRYFVLDTETASLTEGVCEIGWLELDEQAAEKARVDSLIDPEVPITASASGVHGIVAEDVADKPTLREFFSESSDTCYGEPLKADRLVVIGHRVDFDLGFVRPYLEGEVLPICTLRWARQLWPDAEDHKLATLKYALNLRKDAGTAHRVMADVQVTYDLLRLILQMLNCSLDDLAERSQQPMLLQRMPFGKYKGEHPSTVDVGYWRWALNNMEHMDNDLRFTANYYLTEKQK